MILEICTVTTAEIVARLGINTARSLIEPLVQQPSLCHTHAAKMD